jgi:hypothetical protein
LIVKAGLLLPESPMTVIHTAVSHIGTEFSAVTLMDDDILVPGADLRNLYFDAAFFEIEILCKGIVWAVEP